MASGKFSSEAGSSMMRIRTTHAQPQPGHDAQADSRQCTDERRVLPDRRVGPTTFRSALRRGGRRSGFRRVNEPWSGYVDRLSPWVVALVMWVMVGSALDALFSLVHFAKGFSEANPLMALALASDVEAFVVVKMAVSASGAWILAAHQQYPLATRGLYGIALVYLGVLGIHGILILASG